MHDHAHHNDEKGFRMAFTINLLFSVIEIVGGIFTGSIAILADALHDLSDSIGLGLGWYFHRLSKKSGDNTFSYGYRRFSLLGAIINGSILITGSIIIVYHSVEAFFQPGEPKGEWMVALSVLGIVFNYWAYRRMHSGESLNEQVLSLHLLEDVLGWVAVLIGGILIYFFKWIWVDPLLSLMIATYIGIGAVKRLGSSLRLMLQGVPEKIELREITQRCREIEGVEDVYDIHIWSLDGRLNVITIHLSVEREVSMDDQHRIKSEIRTVLEKWKIGHATIEIEKRELVNKDLLSH